MKPCVFSVVEDDAFAVAVLPFKVLTVSFMAGAC